MKLNTSLCILTLFSLLIGFLLLIVSNPNSSQEIGNLPLTALNLDGMILQEAIVFFIYVLPGSLIMIFSARLLKSTDKKGHFEIVFKVFLLLSGAFWILFGCMPYSPFTEDGYSIIVLLTLVFAALVFFTLLFSSISMRFMFGTRWSFYVTLAVFAIVLIMNFLSLFVFDSLTWIRTNISIVVFFIWLLPLGYWFDKNTRVE